MLLSNVYQLKKITNKNKINKNKIRFENIIKNIYY
jgi:hypothetical protein